MIELIRAMFDFQREVMEAESDRRTLALYVLGCDPLTYSPETAEVMDRMRPLLLDADGKLRNDLDGSPGCENIQIGGVVDELDDNPFEETSR